jgi:hypothetical protein
VSHPTPLHPDADLALVLADLRRNVAAWGDEGMVMRVFRASICLMLLGILDTLIELLADFRAGRLPPVLPAEHERASRVGDSPAIATKCEPADAQAASAAASRPTRARRIDDPSAPPAGAPEHSQADHLDPAPRHPGSRVASPSPPLHRPGPGPGPRAIAFYPSHVPRRPFAKIRSQGEDAFPCPFRYDNELFRYHPGMAEKIQAKTSGFITRIGFPSSHAAMFSAHCA